MNCRNCMFVLVAMLSLYACNDGVNTGNGVGNTEVVFSAESSVVEDSLPVGTDANGTQFVVDMARTFIRRIQFNLPDGVSCEDPRIVFRVIHHPRLFCADGILIVAGPIEVDLLKRETRPPLSMLPIPPLVYRTAEFQVDDSQAADGLVPESDVLFGNAIHIVGHFMYADELRTFEFLLRAELDGIAMSAGSGIVVEDGVPQIVRFILDVGQWFSDVPITDCITAGFWPLIDDELLTTGPEIPIPFDVCTPVPFVIANSISASGRLEIESDRTSEERKER